MIDWAMAHWYLLALALLIGVATGWWIWGASRGAPVRPAPPPAAQRAPLEPVKPDIIPAAPAHFATAPAPVPVSAPPVSDGRPNIAAAVGAPDNLMLIKGIGPKLNGLLGQLGITRYDQIAGWTAADIAEVDGYLGNFQGRITRDNWTDQAAYLARGDVAGFEAKYGALGGSLPG